MHPDGFFLNSLTLDIIYQLLAMKYRLAPNGWQIHTRLALLWKTILKLWGNYFLVLNDRQYNTRILEKTGMCKVRLTVIRLSAYRHFPSTAQRGKVQAEWQRLAFWAAQTAGIGGSRSRKNRELHMVGRGGRNLGKHCPWILVKAWAV